VITLESSSVGRATRERKVNYHPQSGWLDFKPLKGGEKSKGTSVPVALPQETTMRVSGFLEDKQITTDSSEAGFA
jgi:hypothetical protein